MTSRGRKGLVLGVTLAAVGLLCASGVARRFAVVGEYRNFAGDGWQYFHLAEQLHNDVRYAFAPPPVPLANSRLPGYPLFIAAVGKFNEKFVPDQVGFLVARAQCIVDLLTALCAFLIARELGLRAPPWLALALCCASPVLVLCCAYVLSETLATFFATATALLLLRGCRTRLRLHLTAAGALLALGMLVRADAITLAPCFLVPLWLAPRPRIHKLEATMMAIVAAATVMSPWLIRNYVRFRHFHPTGAEWVSKQGDPLPTGAQAWLRTWAVEPRQAADLAWPLTKGAPVFPSWVAPEATDTPAERVRVNKIFDDYLRAGWITPSVNDAFVALARERRARDRVRYYVALPLRRMASMWSEPVPDWEMPMQARELGLPELRADWGRQSHRALWLALLGFAVACGFRRGRPLAALTGIAAASRSIAIAFAVAGGTQRYVIELEPLLLVLAALALAGPAELILCKLSGRPPISA